MNTQLSLQLSEGHLSVIEALLDSYQRTDCMDWDDLVIEDLVYYRGSASGLKSSSSSSTAEQVEARLRAPTVIVMSQDKIPTLNSQILEYRWGLMQSKPLWHTHAQLISKRELAHFKKVFPPTSSLSAVKFTTPAKNTASEAETAPFYC